MHLHINKTVSCEFDEEVFTVACQKIAEMTDEERDAVMAALMLVKIEKGEPGCLSRMLSERTVAAGE